ncbi:unnamed protein product [Dracunculus medinensis]|uniref:ubiquitinyl hydrolase 1 n=1 Tax=Dracunculus medinensis TaxID=318479 RepID=A0A158Q3Z2_DRAME|nr:unnamed protein product [Dracunculus medinensis]
MSPMGIAPKRRLMTAAQRKECHKEIPNELTFEAAWKVFMLNKSACHLHSVPNPKTKNCRENPYCLERLGLQKWDKLLQNIENEKKVNEAMNGRRDIEKMPCGLVNLGNSCYVNSFLQIFFNDPFFRRCIYDWRPVDNFVQPVGETINIEELMLCLQKLFVTLQITPYEDTNAEALVKLLRLDGNQHDALEFQILLFGKIEKLLSCKEEWRSVREAIMNHFKGIIKQTISCKCGRKSVRELPFNPFYLGIDKVKSLSKAIENYFSAEELPDYKCDACESVGCTKSRLSISEPPPVLIIQLNRFTYDMTGRKRKVQSALQYPRTLVLGGVPYDNCAVMIHEGPNADSGHYYDLIKHPGTGQWFTYNDEVVKASPTPGVSTEKDRISRITADMKGCYALIYRRKCDTDISIPDVPSYIAEMVAAKLEEDFIAQTSESAETSQRSMKKFEEYHNRILILWSELQVKFSFFAFYKCFFQLFQVSDGCSALMNPESIVFLPTNLLMNIQRKELNEVSRKDPDSPNKNEKFDEDMENINLNEKELSSSITLCIHGNISLESVRSGQVKAVNRKAANILLDFYQIILKATSGIESRLRTGNDICIDCISELKSESEFSSLIEKKEKLAKQLLRERNKRYFLNNSFYHSDDCVWVSTRSLSHYRRLAFYAREQRAKVDREPSELIFSSASNRSFDKNFVNSISVIETRPKELISNEEEHIRFADSDNENGNSFVLKKRKIDKNSESLERETIRHCIDEILCKINNSLSTSQKDIETNKPFPSSSSLINETYINSSSNMNENFEIHPDLINGHNGSTEVDEMVSLHDSVDNFNSENGLNSTEDQSIQEDSFVIFNGDLLCPHGNFDFESWKTKERRIVVDKSEWQYLVNRIFDRNQLYYISVDELPCSICEMQFKAILCSKFFDLWYKLSFFQCRIDDNEGKERRVKEIKLAIGDLIRSVARRKSDIALYNNQYERAVCKNFLRKMIARFRSHNRCLNTPTICQECILCSEHGMPNAPLDTESLAVPVTLKEWQKILSALNIEEEDAMEIKINNGRFESFCDFCFHQEQMKMDNQHFVYEKGAEIFVKLKNDQNDEPAVKSTGVSEDFLASSSISPKSIRAAVTRRALAKNSMKFWMNSSNTIWELKLKIYAHTGQLPNDQLIYLKDRLLNDNDTLEQSRVDPRELLQSPLVLIVQQPVGTPDEPRQIERGFADTALSHN